MAGGELLGGRGSDREAKALVCVVWLMTRKTSSPASRDLTSTFNFLPDSASIRHPYFDERPGYVQAECANGLVATPSHARKGEKQKTLVAFLASLSLGGHVPRAFYHASMMKYVAHTCLHMLSEVEMFEKEEEEKEAAAAAANEAAARNEKATGIYGSVHDFQALESALVDAKAEAAAAQKRGIDAETRLKEVQKSLKVKGIKLDDELDRSLGGEEKSRKAASR